MCATVGATMGVVDRGGNLLQSTGDYPSSTPYQNPDASSATEVDPKTYQLHIGRRWIGHKGLDICKNEDIMRLINNEDNEKRSFFRFTMTYVYTLIERLEEYEGTLEEKLHSFLEDRIKMGYDNVNDFLRFYISYSLKWNVDILFNWASIDMFDESNMPKKLVDLFPSSMLH